MSDISKEDFTPFESYRIIYHNNDSSDPKTFNGILIDIAIMYSNVSRDNFTCLTFKVIKNDSVNTLSTQKLVTMQYININTIISFEKLVDILQMSDNKMLEILRSQLFPI